MFLLVIKEMVLLLLPSKEAGRTRGSAPTINCGDVAAKQSFEELFQIKPGINKLPQATRCVLAAEGRKRGSV